MRSSDWSSDVCSSDLHRGGAAHLPLANGRMPMSKTRHPHGPCLLPPACEKDCDDVPRELPHYFTGRVLTARDLRDEQGYVLSRLRLRNRLFHGWGVVCGLDVCSHPDPACRDRYVVVEPGIRSEEP